MDLWYVIAFLIANNFTSINSNSFFYFIISGLENFCEDLEFMTGRRISIYWRICWGVITPGLLIIIFIYAMVNLKPLQYSGWDYPDSATGSCLLKYTIIL